MKHALAAGMTHDTYWRATPYEIATQCEAAGIELEAQLSLAAWHVAHVINLVVERKDRVTPADLLGKRHGITVEELPEISRQAFMRSVGLLPDLDSE